MRKTFKLLPVLLLGSTLGGCSLIGSGGYFADGNGQTTCGQPQAQPAQNVCGQTNYSQANYAQPAAAQPTYTQPTYAQAAPVQPSYAQAAPVQPSYAQPNYAQPSYAQPTYVQPTYQQGAYVPPAYGANSLGLRGSNKTSESYIYGTAGGINYDLGEDIYGIQGRVGYQINRLFGVEAEGSFGVIDDTDDITVGGGIASQEVNIDTSFAGFGVLRYPLFGKLNGLTRAGYHFTDIEQEITDAAGVVTDADFSSDGIAYGTGLEYEIDPKTAVRLDYTIYDFDGSDAESLALAVSRKF